jgi:hypothetical protein
MGSWRLAADRRRSINGIVTVRQTQAAIEMLTILQPKDASPATMSTLFKSSEVIMSKPLTAVQVAAALVVLITGAVPAIAETSSWETRNFPAPNGGFLVYRIVNGNPECASYDGRNCLWGQAMNKIRFDEVRPLVCGADHRAKWGVTGYDDPRHWCSLVRPHIIDNSPVLHPVEE